MEVRNITLWGLFKGKGGETGRKREGTQVRRGAGGLGDLLALLEDLGVAKVGEINFTFIGGEVETTKNFLGLSNKDYSGVLIQDDTTSFLPPENNRKKSKLNHSQKERRRSEKIE